MIRREPALGERLVRDRDFVPAAVDGTKRAMRFVASDETVDRYGDIIRASGWQTDNFIKAGGPVLWAHQSREPAIGGVKEIGVVGTQLLASVEFLEEGKSALADTVWAGIEAGFMRAVSVGFAPTGKINSLLDEKGNFTGYEFTSQELLELSVVPVPANPQALALAKSLGLSTDAARTLFTDGTRAVAQAAREQRRRTLSILAIGGSP